VADPVDEDSAPFDPSTAFTWVYARTSNVLCWGCFVVGWSVIALDLPCLSHVGGGVVCSVLLAGLCCQTRLTYYLARYLCRSWYAPYGRAGTYRGFRAGVGTSWDLSDD
jgi:hypothetical protein